METTIKTLCVALVVTYNEERFIGSLVLKARRYVDLVIVVDNGSKDETATLAEAAGAVVVRQSNMGKAGVINIGLEKVREYAPVAVVMLDGSGRYDPKDIPTMLEPVLKGTADVVVASRLLDSESNTPKWRVPGQLALTVSQDGFWALSLHAIEILSVRTTGGSFESEMQLLVTRHDLSVSEAPIFVNYEVKSKLNPFSRGMQGLNDILRMIGQNRPLFYFGVPGTVLLTLGLVLAVLVVDTYWRYSQFALGTAIIIMMLCVTGALSIFTGLILHAIRAYLYTK